MAEREDDAGPTPSHPEQTALERYLEHQERMLRYDREYLDRLKHVEPAPPAPVRRPDLPWGNPICDRCGRRAGCGLLQAMKDIEAFAGLAEDPEDTTR
jgi:hypothetical protein